MVFFKIKLNMAVIENYIKCVESYVQVLRWYHHTEKIPECPFTSNSNSNIHLKNTNVSCSLDNFETAMNHHLND